MKLKNLCFTSLLLVFSAFSVVHSEEVESIENAYVQCGIGAAIFKNNKTAAIISNIIWDLGTTAISSQTSSPETCEGKKDDSRRLY